MNLVNSSTELILQEPGFEGMIKHVDYCAGVCYGREGAHDTTEKQLKFVNNLIQRGHYRPLEFGTIYLKVPPTRLSEICLLGDENPLWTKIADAIPDTYIVTNLRVIVEMCFKYDLFKDPYDFISRYWIDDRRELLQYLPDRKTIKMKCSRAVADEARTHITLSSLMKSTRYCNFRDKFNVVKPYWYDQNDLDQQMVWVDAVKASEEGYYKMLDLGLNPQEARGVLPLDIETELLLCGFTNQKDEGWDRFLKLRTDKAAHPDIQILANQIKQLI